jgi:hypothetical protein
MDDPIITRKKDKIKVANAELMIDDLKLKVAETLYEAARSGIMLTHTYKDLTDYVATNKSGKVTDIIKKTIAKIDCNSNPINRFFGPPLD